MPNHGNKQHFTIYASSVERPWFDGYSSVALTDADKNEAIAFKNLLMSISNGVVFTSDLGVGFHGATYSQLIVTF